MVKADPAGDRDDEKSGFGEVNPLASLSGVPQVAVWQLDRVFGHYGGHTGESRGFTMSLERQQRF